MAKGFDGLIEFLLEEIALAGERGASSADFRRFVQTYYDQPDRNSGGLTFNGLQNAPLMSVVDQKLYEKVWQWLVQHPDIRIGDGRKKGWGLGEFENAERIEEPPFTDDRNESSANLGSGGDRDQAASDALPQQSSFQDVQLPTNAEEPSPSSISERIPHTQLDQSQNLAPESGLSKEGNHVHSDNTKLPASVTPAKVPVSTKLRIYANGERIWQAITGHGIDYKRLPYHEFVLLSMIASMGQAGIAQPDLTKATGQDKRSVPKRTDHLAEKGYIEKKTISMRGMRTSMCTHRRFLPKVAAKAKSDTSKDVFVDGKLVLENLIGFIYDLMKDIKLVSLVDLRRKLGIPKEKTWQGKALTNACLRLEGTGLIKRVKAKQAGTSDVWLRCIKLLREPNEEDSKALNFGQRAMPSAPMQGILEEDREGDEDLRDLDLEVDYGDWNNIDNNEHDEVEEIRRIPPQWVPDRPITNLIFRAIELGGESGFNTENIRNLTMGKFWRRPLEETLNKFADVWEENQPRHLQHFTVIRDTLITSEKRFIHYVYRTYDNFQKAVDLEKASWEAVRSVPAKKRTCRGHPPKNPIIKDSDVLDEWGFPLLSKKLFLGGDGSATLQDCRNSIREEASTHGKSWDKGLLYRIAVGERPYTPQPRKRGSSENQAGRDQSCVSDEPAYDDYGMPIARDQRQRNALRAAREAKRIRRAAEEIARKEAEIAAEIARKKVAAAAISAKRTRDAKVASRNSNTSLVEFSTANMVSRPEYRPAEIAMSKAQSLRTRKGGRPSKSALIMAASAPVTPSADHNKTQEIANAVPPEVTPSRPTKTEESITPRSHGQAVNGVSKQTPPQKIPKKRGRPRKNPVQPTSEREDIGIPLDASEVDVMQAESLKHGSNSERGSQVESTSGLNAVPTPQNDGPAISSSTPNQQLRSIALLALQSDSPAAVASSPARDAIPQSVPKKRGRPRKQQGPLELPKRPRLDLEGPEEYQHTRLRPQTSANSTGLIPINSPAQITSPPSSRPCRTATPIRDPLEPETTSRGRTRKKTWKTLEMEGAGASSNMRTPERGHRQARTAILEPSRAFGDGAADAESPIMTTNPVVESVEAPLCRADDGPIEISRADPVETISSQTEPRVAEHDNAEQETSSVDLVDTIPAIAESMEKESSGAKASKVGRPKAEGSQVSPEQFEKRVQEIMTQFTERPEPGLYINPYGTRKIGGRGRPRRALMAIFKFNRLNDFDWFKASALSEPPPSHPSQSSVERSLAQPRPGSKPQGDDSDGDSLMRHALPSPVGFCGPEEFDVPSAGLKRKARRLTMNNAPPPKRPRLGSQKTLEENLGLHQMQLEPVPGTSTNGTIPNDSSSTVPSIGAEGLVSNNQDSTAIAPATLAIARRSTSGTYQSSYLQDDQLPVPNAEVVREPPALPTPVKRKGVHLGGGSVNHLRNKIIFDILERCNGVYPGAQEIYTPFLAMWEQNVKAEATIPDRSTFNKTIKNLIDSGKIRNLTFSFQTPDGMPRSRRILTLPSVDPVSAVVKSLQKEMISKFPDHYVPTEVSELIRNGPRRGHHANYTLETDTFVEPLFPVANRLQERIEASIKARAERTKKAVEVRENVKRQRALRESMQSNNVKRKPGRPPRVRLDKLEDSYKPNQRTIARPDRSVSMLWQLDPTVQTAIKNDYENIFEQTEDGFSEPDYDEDEFGNLIILESDAESSASELSTECTGDEDDATTPLMSAGNASLLKSPNSAVVGCHIPPLGPTRSRPPTSLQIQKPFLFSMETPYPKLHYCDERFSTALTNPAIQFYPNLGVFSTEFSLNRDFGKTLNCPPKTWNVMFEQRLGPKDFDKDYEKTQITTLTDPDVRFYPSIGTFSTEFLVEKNARLTLWVNASKENFRARMPNSLQDITGLQLSAGMVKRPTTHEKDWTSIPKHRQFFTEVDDVLAWEQHHTWLPETKELRFINHSMPGEHITPTNMDFPDLDFSQFAMFDGNLQTADARKYRQRWIVYDEDFPQTPYQHDADQEVPEISEGGGRALHENMTQGPMPEIVPKRKRNRNPIRVPKPVKHKPRAPRGTQLGVKRGPYKKREAEPTSALTMGAMISKPPRKIPIKENTSSELDDEDMKKLIFAIVAVRVLAGGVDQKMNWVLATRVFSSQPNLRPVYLKQRGKALLVRYAGEIEKLMEEFQDRFISAYERGEVPSIHYFNVNEYAWDTVVDWAVNNISMPDTIQLAQPVQPVEPTPPPKLAEMPNPRQTSKPLKKIASLDVVTVDDPRDTYHRQATSHVLREQWLSGYSYAMPLHPHNSINASDDEDLMLAKSWIRANIGTPESYYDARMAHDKLSQLGESVTDAAITELYKAQVLKKKSRHVPGRNYEFSAPFLKKFRPHFELNDFQEAVEFKRQMDEAFKREADQDYDGDTTMADSHSSPSFTLTQHCKHGALIALSTLLAHNRITLIPRLPPVNSEFGAPLPRLSVWGFVENNYKAYTMDRDRLFWDIDVVPTSQYWFGNSLLTGPEEGGVEAAWKDLPSAPVPDPNDPKAKIPLWCDIYGGVMSEWWERAVSGIVQLAVCRAGINLENVVLAMGGKMDKWEIKVVVDWLLANGVLSEIHCGGLIAGEAWWAVCGTLEGRVLHRENGKPGYIQRMENPEYVSRRQMAAIKKKEREERLAASEAIMGEVGTSERVLRSRGKDGSWS
ncbi:hypothetical protein K432DRAFT_429346 [Lepidopterella palustris CBS 459.81]|uniref:B-block binding subunit of TFIIIC domain-containing protein n=1 Tax=Lepidopterella palustris CBS 459.81 TaxID=1314670 RepID=A0A8E2E1P2_9PEZI|nr:hypothetical protein K432DRAFT_429346 [Lepidopterella palustris CBS 459.81]